MTLRMLACGIAAALFLTAAPAVAQNEQDQSQGQVTANETKHVGDWMVRCFAVKSPTPCDMIYILAFKNTGQMMLSMRLAYAPAQEKSLLQIGVPLGVAFARGLVVTTDAGATQPMPFQRCDRSGCYVSSVMDNASLDAVARSTAANTKVMFAGVNGKVVNLPFPLNGFAEARDSLVQLSKGRATAPQAPKK